MVKLPPPREHLQTAVAAAGWLALLVAFGIIHKFRFLTRYIVETIAVAMLAGVVYLVILYLLERVPDRRLALWVIVLGAIAFRLQLFPLWPAFSNDLYRFRWEGRVQAVGENPYLVRPDDPRLVPLRDARWERVPGRDAASIYPPLAEIVFRGLGGLFGKGPPAAIILYKLPFLLADLAIVGMLAWWVPRNGGRNWQVAIYAWNPLVIFETAASGHYDSLVAAAVLAASLAIISGRRAVSMLLLAAGVLLKWFPIVLLPLWLRRAGWPRTRASWLGLLGAAALAAVCAWPYRSAWPQLLDNLMYYESRWRHNNASLYSLAAWLSGSSELATGLGLGVVAGLALWATARQVEPLRAAYLLIGAILMLAPNVFAWYCLWIVPFLVFIPNPAWLMLTVLQFLSYHVVLEFEAMGMWRFRPEMLWLTYGPFYALLLWQWRKTK